jgi:hypothetical protein
MQRTQSVQNPPKNNNTNGRGNNTNGTMAPLQKSKSLNK